MNAMCKIILIIFLLLFVREVISLIYYIYIGNKLESSIRHLIRCVNDIFDVLNAGYKYFNLDTNGYTKEAKVMLAKLYQLRCSIHISTIGPFSSYYVFDKYMEYIFNPFYADATKLIDKYYDNYCDNYQFKKSIDLFRKRSEEDLAYIENFRKKNRVKESWKRDCDYNDFINELKISLDNIKVGGRRL